MGLLGNLGDAASNSANALLSTITDPFKVSKTPVLLPPDFKEGFQITEIIAGKEGTTLALVGDMLPMVPFKFGGEQKIVKDYYPGNAEPVVQVLGARETSVTITGRLKAKRYTDPKFIQVPDSVQRELDAIRLRGNLVKITLGEWKRFGFLEKTEFELRQLSRIGYELTFSIIGFNIPTNCKILDDTLDVPFNYNSDLIAAAAAFQAQYSTLPKGFPGGLADFFNGLISDVAKYTNIVTNFVSTAIKTAQDLVNSVNRAIGLILNAKAAINRFALAIRGIQLSISQIGTTTNSLTARSFTTAALISQSSQNASLVVSAYNNSKFILQARSDSNNLLSLLASLQKQISAFQTTQPMARYPVKRNDTLQKIAFKYYNNSDNWKLIYDHNKLTSTDISGIGVLEIPKG
jgi:uncharacterized protein YoxC